MKLLPLVLGLAACAGRVSPVAVSPLDAALGPANDCAAFESAELQRRLDRHTHSQLMEGNAVDLLVNGEQSFARRLDRARDADLILVKTFIWTDDTVGREVSELLRARARAGATVIVQYDFKGSIQGLGSTFSLYDGSKNPRFFQNKPLLDQMRADGVIVVPTNVPRIGRQTRRRNRNLAAAIDANASLFAKVTGLRNFVSSDHEKYWITGKLDGAGHLELEAILGGMNIASEYAYGGTDHIDPASGRGGWRDTDIAVRGPVTEAILHRYFDVLMANSPHLSATFDRDRWQQAQPQVGPAAVRFVWNQPAAGNERRIEALYRELIQATPPGGLVRVEVAYFTPPKGLLKPLEVHLRDGKRAMILTNSAESTDLRVVNLASRAVYARLLQTSPTAALFEWVPKQGLSTLHSKVASFGTCGPVIVGSFNLDGYSSEHNSESVVVVQDPTLRARFDQMMQEDLADGSARRVTSEDVSRTPAIIRWLQSMIYRHGWDLLSR